MALRIVADALQPLAAEGFADVGEVTVLPPAAITREALRDADALVCRSTVKVTPELLEGTAVRFVGTCTIGFDHVDREWLASRGIAFASAPGCNANSVGEWFVAAMLTWAVEKGVSLAGKTLGVVGAGHVGKIVAARAAALRMRVLVNDPPRARAEGGAGFVALPELLAASDFVTVHVPLTREGRTRPRGWRGRGFSPPCARGRSSSTPRAGRWWTKAPSKRRSPPAISPGRCWTFSRTSRAPTRGFCKSFSSPPRTSPGIPSTAR